MAMASTSSSSAPSHGFEDALSPDGLKTKQLVQLINNFTPAHFNRDVLEEIWELAMGSTTSFRRVYVVGDRETLDGWAPKRRNTYPKFIAAKEYKQRHRDDDDDDQYDEEDEHEEIEPLFSVDDGLFVILLPGEYECRSLWDSIFTGSNLVVGLGMKKTTVFNAMTLGSIAECQGKTCICGCTLDTRALCDAELLLITGSTRLVACRIGPREVDPETFYGNSWTGCGAETGPLVGVQHGASLVAELILIGPSTETCITCEGQCTVYVDLCLFQRAGRGDKVQRISKANGTFPDVLQGVCPAIAVSYAATLRAKDCSFLYNYGYPVQYANKAEQEGTTDQYLFDTDPEQSAREKVRRQIEMIERDTEDFDYKSFHRFDLTTEEGKERMFRRYLARRLEKIAQADVKRTKGSVEMTGCRCVNDAMSRHLPNLPDDYEVTVEPWFTRDSKMLELVDEEEGCWEICQLYDHDEAKEDRDAWRRAQKRSSRSISQITKLSPTAKLFGSFASGGSLAGSLGGHFSEIMSSSDPFEFFCKQRREERNGNGASLSGNPASVLRDVKAMEKVTTLYGCLDEDGRSRLRETMLFMLEGSRRNICGVMERLTEAPDTDELFQICWGCLACIYTSFADAITAEAGLVALYDTIDRPISPYRAEVLVERMQCDDIDGRPTNDDGCDCECCFAPAQFTAFLLGLSHNSIVDALSNLVKDKLSSDHGRSNAGGILMRLGFCRPELRDRVVEALSTAISDDSEMSRFSRSLLVEHLSCLHAIESKNVVAEACRLEKIDGSIGGGYITFLRQVGLPVDVNDPVASEAINIPSLIVLNGVGERDLRELSARVTARTKKSVAKHNTKLRGPPCDRCDKEPAKGVTFPMCTRCYKVSYCGSDCQRASWPEHKKSCKPREGKSK
jgi:hypothetical protein